MRSCAFDVAVGKTALVPLRSFASRRGQSLYAKCEFLNPLGSVKDRIAAPMIRYAEAQGLIEPGRSTIVEATAGNTGLALAAAALPRGYRVTAVINENVGPDKEALLHAWGADVVRCSAVTPGDRSSFRAVAAAIAAERPNHHFIDQFSNPANLATHIRSTGPELFQQTSGRIDALIGGVGTGGTLMGIATYLRERLPSVRIVLADPVGSVLADLVEHGCLGEARPYKVEGIGGDVRPPFLRPDLITDVVRVEDAESVSACLEFGTTEGIRVGFSSGCVLAAARRFLAGADASDLHRVVVLLADSGDRYLQTVYNPAWRAAHLF